MSALAAMGVNGLRHDTYVPDACLFDGIHYSGESAKGNIFIGAQVNRLVLRIANSLLQGGPDLVDVDGVVAEINLLRLVDTDDQPLFRDLFHSTRMGHTHFDPRLQHRRGHHEDDEQHKHDIHQGSYVDVGKRGLGASVGVGEGHQRRTSTGWGVCRSTRLSISSEKSSLRAASSRMEPLIRLYAITAGMAAASPPAVVTSASEIPGATARKVAAPAVPRPWNASMIPQTVPKRPTKGVTAPVIASHVTLRSSRVIPSEEAICMDRWMAGRLWMPPVVPIWRLNSTTA